jgi:hypothetical protein
MKRITLRLICFVLLVAQLPVFNLAQTPRYSTTKQQPATSLEQNGIQRPEQISVITETAGKFRRRQSRKPVSFDDEFSAST